AVLPVQLRVVLDLHHLPDEGHAPVVLVPAWRFVLQHGDVRSIDGLERHALRLQQRKERRVEVGRHLEQIPVEMVDDHSFDFRSVVVIFQSRGHAPSFPGILPDLSRSAATSDRVGRDLRGCSCPRAKSPIDRQTGAPVRSALTSLSMPDPVKLLATIRRAVEAFLATPGRRGREIVLEDAAEVLVAGDLHGNLPNFKAVLLKADLARNPARHLVVQEVIHGPFRYPMGGDKSHQLLDLVLALKAQYPRQVHFLLGNHELAQATNNLISKAEVDLNELFLRGVEEAYGEESKAVYQGYLDAIAVCP